MRRGSGKRTARSAECHYCQDRDCGRLDQSPPPPCLPKELLGTNPITEQAGPHLSLLRESHLRSFTLRCPSDKDKCQGRRWDHKGGKRGGGGGKKQCKAPCAEAIFRGRRRWPGTKPLRGEEQRAVGWGWWTGRGTLGLEGAAAC